MQATRPYLGGIVAGLGLTALCWWIGAFAATQLGSSLAVAAIEAIGFQIWPNTPTIAHWTSLVLAAFLALLLSLAGMSWYISRQANEHATCTNDINDLLNTHNP